MNKGSNIQKVVKTSGQLDSCDNSRPEKGRSNFVLSNKTGQTCKGIKTNSQEGKKGKRLNGDNSMNDYCPAGSMKSEIKKREKKKE